MKTNNYWFRKIAEKVTSKSYGDYLGNKFFLKEILKAYDVVVDRPLSFNRLLREWYEAVAGVVVDGVFTDHYYLKRLADFLAGYDVGLKTGNFYLGLIAELIDSKESSSVSLSVGSVSPFVSDVVTLSGVLEPFGGSVKLYDGESLLDTLTASDVDGSFSKSWTATLGAHSFRAVFEETEDYRGSESEIVVVNVVKKSTVLSLSAVDSSLFVDDNLVLNGSLLWNGNAVSGASVKLYQDETLLDTLTTDSSGSFTKTVSGLSADTYEYYAVYDGTSVYESSQSQEVSVEVSKYATSLSLNVPMNLVYSDSFNLSGVLKDENNNVLKNMSVKLLVDGVEKATTTTDNTGTASFTQTPVRTGNHTFQLRFDETYKYKATVSSVVSRVVDKETSVLSVSSPLDNSSHYVNDDISVVGSLLEDDGVAMKSKTITVGDKGTVSTGNNGAFSKTISYDVKGSKTLTVSYAGDENYTASSVTRTLTLLQKTPVITISGSKSEIYTNESVIISGTLKYNNNAVKNHSIKIYDGSTLLDTVTTGNNGAYSKTVSGLTKGVHTLKAVSVETNEYESVTSSNVSVEVFNVITGVSIEADKSIISGYHSEVCTLTAKLIDKDGAVVTKDNLNITFKKDGTAIGSAVATTDGVATKTFTASNGGELKLKAEYNTFHDTCTVEDIYYYTDGKTDLHEWTNESGVTQTYTTNGICLSTDSTTRKFAKLDITYPSAPYTVEYKLTGITRDTSSNATPTFMLNGVVTDDTKSGFDSSKIRLFQIPSSVIDSYDGAYSVGDTLRFVYDGANVTVLQNNSVIGHKSVTSSYPGAQLRLYVGRGACISDIKVDGLDLNSILLASDKSIISYIDSETCTLSATVKDSNGVAITTAGVLVSFYNGENLLGTSYTNSNGVATYTYTSTGVGDIVLSAKIGNNITSNSINIEDCQKYGFKNTDTFHNIGTGGNSQITDGTLTGYNVALDYDIDYTKDFIIEAEVKGAVNTGYGFIEKTMTTSYDKKGAMIKYYSKNQARYILKADGSEIYRSDLFGVVQNQFKPVKFIKYEDNVSLYVDNVLVSTQNGSTMGVSTANVEIHSWSNTNVSVKDLKIKAFNVGEIVLTSDKTILSYADSDSCTLTATLENGQGVPASAGIPVSFYNGATLLGTSYTNNNGVATYTYNSQGVGDLTITAKAGNNITSNNIQIEDTTFYDPATTNQTSKYTLNNGQTITYNSKEQAYELMSSATWGYTSVPVNLSKPFILETDLKILSTGASNKQPRLIFNLANNDWIGCRICGAGIPADDIRGHLYKNGTSILSDQFLYSAIQEEWYHLELIWDGMTLTNRLLKDNILIGSINTNRFTGETGERGIGICCGVVNTGCQFKGLKVKPLTVDSISLASDKSILSYVDSETATLSATVSKSYGSVANIPVQFYNESVWLGTGVTNSSGVATYTYTSAGIGDMTVTAKVGSITSNDITIHDIAQYKTLTDLKTELNNGATTLYGIYKYDSSTDSGLTNGVHAITDNLELDGQDATIIDGGNTIPIFTLNTNIDHITLENLTVKNTPRVLYIDTSGIINNITLNGNFLNNTRSEENGAILKTIGQINGTILLDGYYEGNKSVHAGVIHSTGTFGENAIIQLSGTFKNNSSNRNGGVAGFGGSNELQCKFIFDGEFISNKATQAGGIAYFTNIGANCEMILNGVYTSNTATTNGGCFSYNGSIAAGAKLTFSGTFTNNTATTNGGVAYYSGTNKGTCTYNGTFNGNTPNNHN